MNAVKILPHYTYEDYCQWEERWELIDGIPFEVHPAPNHQWVVANISSEFLSEIKKIKLRQCKVYSFLDTKIKEDPNIASYLIK